MYVGNQPLFHPPRSTFDLENTNFSELRNLGTRLHVVTCSGVVVKGSV